MTTTPDQSGSSSAEFPWIGLWPDLVADIEARQERLVRFRRRIHATPEASNEEFHTTALVAETIRELGLEPTVMSDGLGVILDVDFGGAAGSAIALRSELDCVQVNDDKQTAYASTRPGLCHACGHDVHSTILIATIAAVADRIDALRACGFRHNLRWIFQPAEEAATGARSMIKQGAIDGVDAIIAVHVEPFLDVGTIGLREGPMTSGCKAFRIHVRGRSGHSARPHEAIDPIPAVANLTTMLYQLCPRTVDARHPEVLTVAAVQAGSTFNGIPDEAVMMGTLRTTRLEDTESMQHRMEQVIAGVQQATGCEIELDFPTHAPPTRNDRSIIDVMARAAEYTVGREGVHWIPLPSLGAEDFAFYQELIPGAIVRLGAGTEDTRTRRPLHSSLFDIDEDAIGVGARFLLRSALELASGDMNPIN